jgi:hypothetical protein
MDLEPFIFSRDGYVVGMRAASPSGSPAAEPVEGEGLLAQVNSFALRPLAMDEFVVFTMDLCHNQMDRHFSRFPDEELEKINRMVPGRPLMERHDLRGTLPRGTFFRSALHNDDARGRLSVRPDVYVLRTPDNASFIQNIEGGVYRETSIGFSFKTPECALCGKDLRTCDHVPGRTYGDAVCHYVMRDVLEVIEGSVVPTGSQGTAFVPRSQNANALSSVAAGAGRFGPMPLDAALDAGRQAFHRPIELCSKTVWADE